MEAMENKNVLNNEELGQVSGGAGAETSYIHSNCGGHITCEDFGAHVPDIWMKCQKCGKEWHPHHPNNVGKGEDIYTVTTGTY